MKEQIVKIGKTNFKIRKFGVLLANEKLADLVGFIAPIAGSLLQKVGVGIFGLESGEENKKEAKKEFSDAFDKLARINSTSLRSIMNLLLVPEYIEVQLRDGSYVKYGEDVLDDVFEEDPTLLLELIKVVAEINFSTFFMKIASVFLDETDTKTQSFIQK